MDWYFADRIEKITKHPNFAHVFGATEWSNHGFGFTPHSTMEIENLQDELGIRLPEEYARFLIELGSGPGPYCGLYSPARILSEIRLDRERTKDSDYIATPSALFPFGKTDALTIRERVNSRDPNPWGEAPWLSNGCIPIGEQGCTLYSALVTSGELRGTVWDLNDDGAIAQWLPATRPVGLVPSPAWKLTHLPELPTPPTFLQWYESWLERVETDLPNYCRFTESERIGWLKGLPERRNPRNKG